MDICMVWNHIYKENLYSTIEETSVNYLTAKQYISKWLHRFTTNVCVTVFHAGHSDATVFTACTFVASAKR